MPWSRLILAVCVAVYAGAWAWPSYQAVSRAEHGRDFATFYYAASVARAGGDPYDKGALSAKARSEGTRSAVHPYFYPPPFLLAVWWAPLLPLATASKAWWWINQGAVVAVGVFLRRWLHLPWWMLGVGLATFAPLPDNCKMGQVNLVVLAVTLLALRRESGAWLSPAGMTKMSPALYITVWAAQRRWRQVAAAAVGAVGLSALALVVVPFDTQLHFYTDILPRFATGDYNGLTVKITLPANHSIPDLYNQLWPEGSGRVLGPAARRASSLTSLGLLAGLTWLARRRRDGLGQALLFGVTTVLLVVAPVYTYEHHLVFALVPVATVFAALLGGRLPSVAWAPAVFAYGLVAQPLWLLRDMQAAAPGLRWILQESKFFGLVVLATLCVWGVVRSPNVSR